MTVYAHAFPQSRQAIVDRIQHSSAWRALVRLRNRQATVTFGPGGFVLEPADVFKRRYPTLT